jgi:hypothetical protein
MTVIPVRCMHGKQIYVKWHLVWIPVIKYGSRMDDYSDISISIIFTCELYYYQLHIICHLLSFKHTGL